MPGQDFPVPFSNYSSSRIDVDQQSRVNMFPLPEGGLRQFPGLVEFAAVTVAAPSYVRTGTLPTSSAGDISFDDDGDRMYQVDPVTDKIYETVITVAEDVSAFGAVANFTFNYVGAPNSVCHTWNKDGSILLVGDLDELKIYQHTATTYQVSTLVYASKSLDVSAELTSGALSGVGYMSGGTKLLVFGNSATLGYAVFQYSLPTAYDLDGGYYDGKAYAVTVGTGPRMFVSEGRVWISSNTVSLLTQLNFVNPTDISTAYSATTFNASAQDNQFTGGIAFFPSGDSFVLADFTAIYQYSTSAAFTWGATVDGRNAIAMAGVFYAVLDNTLYSVDVNGTKAALGDIAGAGRVGLETDGTQLVITTGISGQKVYKYTVAGGLVENADADLDDTAKTSAFLDLRFHYQQPDGKFAVSALNDALNVSGLDIATAESFADPIEATYGHNQLLYLMGQFFSEIWKTTGTSQPPLRRQQVIERGIKTAFSITSIDNNIYFLDHERRLNIMSGLQYTPVPMGALSDEIDSYSTVSDAYLTSYSFQNENFIEITFPTENATWTYHEPSGNMIKREDSSNNYFRAVQYVSVYGQVLVLDRRNGKIYSMADSVYQDDGSNITRTIDSALINSALLGVPNQRLHIPRYKLRYEASGSASISLSYSKDPDLTSFSTPIATTVSGAGVLTLQRFPGGICRETIIRIATTSNARVDLLDQSIEVSVKGDTND